MRNATLTSMVVSLLAFSAYGQPSPGEDHEALLHFAGSQQGEEVREVATVIRSIGGIPEVNVDEPARVLTVKGTAAQVALAEWLFQELQPQAAPRTKRERRVADAGDIVRVFYLTHAEAPQELQEAATVVRSIGDIRRLFIVRPRKAMVVRGTADEIALAEWVVERLDQPGAAQAMASAAGQEYKMAGGGDENVVRVLFPRNGGTLEELHKAAVDIRVATQIRRAFLYTALGALVVRGTPDQIAQAERVAAGSNR